MILGPPVLQRIESAPICPAASSQCFATSMPSRRFASSRSARLRGALLEMWAARTPVFAIASARRSRYFFDDGCEGSKSPGRVSPPDLRLQEL